MFVDSTASWGHPGVGGTALPTLPTALLAPSLLTHPTVPRENCTPQGHSLLIAVGTCRQHLETCCCHRAGRGTVGLGTMLAEPAVQWLLGPC